MQDELDLTIVDYIYAERVPEEIPKLLHLDNQIELDDMFERHNLPRIIDPGERWLMGVNEFTEIPTGVAGLVELRSTLGRAGFISPPTFADPLFHGHLTLELWNLNRFHSFLIEPGMQLFFLLTVLGYNVPDYSGRYQGQLGITLPKAFVQSEIPGYWAKFWQRHGS